MKVFVTPQDLATLQERCPLAWAQLVAIVRERERDEALAELAALRQENEQAAQGEARAEPQG